MDTWCACCADNDCECQGLDLVDGACRCCTAYGCTDCPPAPVAPQPAAVPA